MNSCLVFIGRSEISEQDRQPKILKTIHPDSHSENEQRLVATTQPSTPSTSGFQNPQTDEATDEGREQLYGEQMEPVIDDDTYVRNFVNAELALLKADPAQIFTKEYLRLREQASNNFDDLMPGLHDMPEDWPGIGLEHGLSRQHVAPTFWKECYTGGDRDESGRRKGTNDQC
ncbi:hypothetical protein HYPSUDRAFT_209356 [Hypholoma sublateritium FD-334 SS-4]|uniref:Uncharacterized protein n=1 Tax=Hypholoma sublateritium (strain FD-334 SS-4) TaxID=945553 RepID=A0A0D2NZ16_HYPSF|nr:hypothetical protein HYPSUDRAFT_209356 [Hypholoma sublateritium FD-334 SS-4]